MKTLMTTFAIAVMVFAFNVTPSHAGDSDGKAVYECTGWTHQGTVYGEGRDCKRVSELDDIRDLEQTAWANAPEGQFTEGEIDGLEEPEQQIAVDSAPGEGDSGNEIAGLSPAEKRKQDEDDWNAWIRAQQFAFIGEAFCAENPDNYICSDFSNQDQDETVGQREFANSGEEGSFSAAGVTLGGAPTDVVEGEAEEMGESLNDRVLRTGSY